MQGAVDHERRRQQAPGHRGLHDLRRQDDRAAARLPQGRRDRRGRCQRVELAAPLVGHDDRAALDQPEARVHRLDAYLRRERADEGAQGAAGDAGDDRDVLARLTAIVRPARERGAQRAFRYACRPSCVVGTVHDLPPTATVSSPSTCCLIQGCAWLAVMPPTGTPATLTPGAITPGGKADGTSWRPPAQRPAERTTQALRQP